MLLSGKLKISPIFDNDLINDCGTFQIWGFFPSATEIKLISSFAYHKKAHIVYLQLGVESANQDGQRTDDCCASLRRWSFIRSSHVLGRLVPDSRARQPDGDDRRPPRRACCAAARGRRRPILLKKSLSRVERSDHKNRDRMGRVTIPKPDGGERGLGIPTVTDGLTQQALLQVLQPLLDPPFSKHSYGFRPGRRAHDAVLAAQSYVQAGRAVVVDVDLEKFLERASHYTPSVDWRSKRSGRAVGTWILKPFLRPQLIWTARSSPRFTRCKIVWRDAPSRCVALSMVT